MKVAAYQAPLLRSGSPEAVDLIRTQVAWCESQGVIILCCPEAILGGLADYAADPREFAIDTRGDHLGRALAPLASDTVTTIVGFTEVTDGTVLIITRISPRAAVSRALRRGRRRRSIPPNPARRSASCVEAHSSALISIARATWWARGARATSVPVRTIWDSVP